jgi:tetratricopeptide (TPR) repeat protein
MNRQQRRAAGAARDPVAIRERAVAQFRRGDVGGARRTLEQALARHPHHDLWLLLSGVLTHLARYDEAIAACTEALALEPNLLSARHERSGLLLQQGRLAEAAADLRSILARAPDDAQAASNLGSTLFRLGDLAEADTVLRAAHARHPGHKVISKNLAAVRRMLGDFPGAESAYRAAIAIDGTYAEAHRDLALLRLQQGDWAAGFAEYEWRLRSPERGAPPLPGPRWDGADAPGRTLLVHFEQGFGDTIQFLRFVPQAAARVGRLIVCVPPSLLRLAASIPGVTAVTDASQTRFDLHAYLMSLPHLMKVSSDELGMATPYLSAPADRVAAWQTRLGPLPGRRVGLVLAGNPKHENDLRRSLPVSVIDRLAAVPCVTWIGLRPGAPHHPRVHDVGDSLTDFAETAEVLHACDLLVSVDTAVAHLAGALGRPVWMLLPHVADWRWGLSGQTTRWYPSMRLFRQPGIGDWDTVIERVAQELIF